ncbi:MAG TPA: HAMP domain-containing sensor histidine kinase [Bacteroidia bacterium]
MKSTAKTPWLFYALVIYVVMQFLWWEVLLTRQTKQLAEEQKKTSALSFLDKNLLEENFKEIELKKNHQLWMHLGEGTVFLILLSLGVLKIYNTRKKENDLVRLQRNFLLSVTHELKSPLASVKLQLQTMQKHKLDEVAQQNLLQKALADNERLLRMIDNVLLASKADNEHIILHIKKIDLAQWLTKLIEQGFDENKHRIKLAVATDVFVEADEQLLSIIFSNLIENAIKYSPENALIEINGKQENKKTIVSVSDNGVGIPDSEREKVFDKFYRIGNEATRSAKGTGLGLHIVKSLCALHKIDISIATNKPKGTVFRLVFTSQ